ncbi:hypothetical protein YDYSY3_27770 [Paenibacillus chitinolyticus]|uniref:hypothetical protein n=1 Tax=Paenibacillus chitinolyticus TaxID=79263 RepID=UPI0026E498E5|nr:hypothetical protein [Paenibacillus chitinolyticus]GKS11777.1 hypothetical protein YDYSY3_27770 [Paenibacillus chitinolyticus]
MNKNFFEEMHKLSHDDEMRYKLLIQGVKRLLEDRKRGRNKLMRVLKFPQRKKDMQAAKWS